MSDDLRELYQELILDHGKHPHNFHPLENANREAVGHNPLCGDKLILRLLVDAQNKIVDAAFQGSGCAISTASASMMTDMLKGKSADDAQKLFTYFHALCKGEDAPSDGLLEDDIDRLHALSGVKAFPVRVKCATLAWHTLQAALENKSEDVSTEK